MTGYKLGEQGIDKWCYDSCEYVCVSRDVGADT